MSRSPAFGRTGVLAVIAAGLLFSAPSAMVAQTRPLLTEEAATRPSGTLRLEAGLDYIRAETNFLTGRRRDRVDVPTLHLVYSPSGNVEMGLEWVVRVFARGDPDFGDVSDFGDVTLRAKWRFCEERPGRPGLAARFGVTLPQTSFGSGLGPNTLRMTAQVLASKTRGRVTAHANGGVAIQDEALRPHEQRDLFAYGLAVVHRSAERLSVAAELAGLAGDGMPGTDARAELRLGLRYGRKTRTWDIAIRRGLAMADGRWGMTAGVTWVLRRKPIVSATSRNPQGHSSHSE